MPKTPNLPLLPELAAALQSTEKNALARLTGLKLTPVCDRCGGCGNYSFNQRDGTVCFGCGGSGHRFPKAKEMPALVQAAQKAAAAGRRADYLAVLKARQVARSGMARVMAAWKATHAARCWAGWASHSVGYANMPGNAAEVREASHRMYEAYKAVDELVTATLRVKPASPDYAERTLEAERAIEETILLMDAVDVVPTPDLIEYVQGHQRAAAEKVLARGFKPGFEIYA
jgi:hypothetical protein